MFIFSQISVISVLVTWSLPVSTKALDESKGYIIADYQDFLEKEWVDSLRKKYTVQISKAAFESLIKQ